MHSAFLILCSQVGRYNCSRGCMIDVRRTRDFGFPLSETLTNPLKYHRSINPISLARWNGTTRMTIRDCAISKALAMIAFCHSYTDLLEPPSVVWRNIEALSRFNMWSVLTVWFDSTTEMQLWRILSTSTTCKLLQVTKELHCEGINILGWIAAPGWWQTSLTEKHSSKLFTWSNYFVLVNPFLVQKSVDWLSCIPWFLFPAEDFDSFESTDESIEVGPCEYLVGVQLVQDDKHTPSSLSERSHPKWLAIMRSMQKSIVFLLFLWNKKSNVMDDGRNCYTIRPCQN